MTDAIVTITPLPVTRDRVASRRYYLMCPPTYFSVDYSINPWMDVTKPVDRAVAVAQWERLRDIYTELGHEVSVLDPIDGLPDMVFTANGATVVDGRVLLANFRHEERAAETHSYRDWFRAHDYRQIRDGLAVNEGEGDFLRAGPRVLAGTGFRTDPAAHHEAHRIFGCPIITLTLVNPYYYHLDTALAVLSDTAIAYYPAAFSPASQSLLRELYPDAILATAEDAAVLGLNAVSDGRHVVLPRAAAHLVGALSERGFIPIGVDVSELNKAGGAVKCCTLELHGPTVLRAEETGTEGLARGLVVGGLPG
jgi:N-dimethylarginine dimethylaminohydrolase